MSIEFIIGTAVTLAGMLAAVVIFSIRTSISVAVALKGNTDAIKSLKEYMALQDKKNDEQDERLDEHDKKLSDHGERIVRIEQTHEVRGCVK